MASEPKPDDGLVRIKLSAEQMDDEHVTVPPPADLAALLPGFDRERLEDCLSSSGVDPIYKPILASAVIAYLEPLVRALAEAKDAAHSRGDEARYHMVTAINDHAELTKALAAERAAREVAEGTIRMAVDRLGGTVEGKPTHEGNFLQRIDELVALEKGRA